MAKIKSYYVHTFDRGDLKTAEKIPDICLSTVMKH